MKATITNRGEGFIDLRLTAETNIETMVLSVAGNVIAPPPYVSLSSYGSGDGAKPRVSIGAMDLEALAILQPKS